MSIRKEIEVKCNGWRSDGAVLNPVEGNLCDLTSLLKDKNTTKVTVIVEQDEAKNIQMTESEFKEIIRITESYCHPAAELRSRLKHGKYHVKGTRRDSENIKQRPTDKELEDEIIKKFAPKPLPLKSSFALFLADFKARMSK